jgi:hypothetical protein
MLEDALMRLRHRDPLWCHVPVINLGGHAALKQDDVPLAARLFTEAIEVGRSVQHTAAFLGAMAGLAGVALARGQAPRAARLLGTVAVARATLGMRRWDNWLHAERLTSETRAALPAADFEQAWAAGRTIPLEEAITETLTIADEVTTNADG